MYVTLDETPKYVFRRCVNNGVVEVEREERRPPNIFGERRSPR